jgi:hypothetical protein
MHTSVWKIPLKYPFFPFPGGYAFCEVLKSPKEEVAALFVSIVFKDLCDDGVMSISVVDFVLCFWNFWFARNKF